MVRLMMLPHPKSAAAVAASQVARQETAKRVADARRDGDLQMDLVKRFGAGQVGRAPDRALQIAWLARRLL